MDNFRKQASYLAKTMATEKQIVDSNHKNHDKCNDVKDKEKRCDEKNSHKCVNSLRLHQRHFETQRDYQVTEKPLVVT